MGRKCRHADMSRRVYFDNGNYQCGDCRTLVTIPRKPVPPA